MFKRVKSTLIVLPLAPQTRAVYYERSKLNPLLGDYQQARRDAERALNLQDPIWFRIGPARLPLLGDSLFASE